MKRATHLLLLFCGAVLSSGCSDSDEPVAKVHEAGGRAVVAVTFSPTAWLVESLSAGEVDVVLPLPAGEDPIFWQPSRADLGVYQAADLIVINGAELEKWVAGASLPLSRVVDSAAGFRDRWLEFEGLAHSHGGGGEHSHVGIDGHTWLSPELFELQAEAVAAALEARELVPADVVAAGLKEVRAELRGLSRQLEEEVLPHAEGVLFLANHPAYDYLLKHAVELVNLDLDPESSDTAGIVAEVAAVKGEAEKCVLLWEAAPLPAVASALQQQLGVTSVEFSPAENVEGDYAAIQSANLGRLAEALRDS